MGIYLGNRHKALFIDGKKYTLIAPNITRPFGYISLGDSIAAGWGVDDRAEDSYFGLIKNRMKSILGSDKMYAANHAEGGDQVNHLMTKLSDPTIRKDVANADIVTICIGANDALTPVMLNLEEYIMSGDSALVTINNNVQANLAKLADDSNPNSYMALFKKLTEINPNAKYLFTTIYSPYKYLWLDDGQNGFFKPLLDTIPDMTILGAINVSDYIKGQLLDIPVVQTLFSRVNGLDVWSEQFVTQINQILRSKLAEYNNPNFYLVDSKALYDSVPDRMGAGDVHYNDLVHVEYTRGYTFGDIHFGALWEGSSATAFWTDLINRYLINDNLNISGLASELIERVAVEVVKPNADPHPDYDGHYLLMRSFVDKLRELKTELSVMPALKTITFNANGASGSMAIQKVADESRNRQVCSIPNAVGFTPATGYRFVAWNTKSDGSGAACQAGQGIAVNSDITLHAQWSNVYNLVFRISEDSSYFDGDDTGAQEKYALWIAGSPQADLGKFPDSRVIPLAYGTVYGVVVGVDKGDGRSYITLNGTKVAGNGSEVARNFVLQGDTDVHFIWNGWLSGISQQNYWTCEITGSSVAQ